MLVLGPGEERPYLGLVKIMHLYGSICHVPADRLRLTDGPDVPPAPMRPLLRALFELTREPWLREFAAKLPPADYTEDNKADGFTKELTGAKLAKSNKLMLGDAGGHAFE